MFKKRVVAALSAALLAGSAAAVELGAGQKGEVLIAPMIMAAGGWESELRVVNTDVLNSAVVKVVFHEPARSAEVLDFLLHLHQQKTALHHGGAKQFCIRLSWTNRDP